MPIKCIEPGCTITSSFNYKGEKTKLYCSTHKKEGMISIRANCIVINCTKQPSYNLKGEKRAAYCATHKLPDMVPVGTNICRHPDCYKHPIYNVEGTRCRPSPPCLYSF